MTKKVRVRSLFLGAVFTLLFVVLVGRLYWLQVVQASELEERAVEMWETKRTLPAERGTIYDRNGNVLAGDAKGYTVVVNPQVIYEYGLEREVVEGLSKILGKPQDELYNQVTSRNSKGELRIYREVRNEGWKITEDVAEEIRQWKQELVEKYDIRGANWQGVTLVEEQLRYYPKDTLAAHVLGYVDKEGNAVMGLEKELDELLRGTPGSIQYVRDRKGLMLPDSKPELIPPVDGYSAVLTIDQTIQHYAETAVKKIYEQYRPKAMTAIAVDPRTMEVLALVNYPTFDPNRYWEYDTERDFRNTAIHSRYEPGSTFKIVTLAGAVDQGIFNPNDKYMSGSIRVPGAVLNDHRIGGWGEITYLEGLLRSSNVAFVKLGYEMLGPEKLEHYIDLFGFREKTGIDLPGEVGGYVKLTYPADYATATYGQGGVLVTPIQQLAAYAAIANGGKLMRPYVVKQIVDSDTKEVIQEKKPTVIREVLSEDKAREIAGYLEQVVSNREIGTGRRAYIEGYRVAAKTGTANIVVGDGYSRNTWVVSIAGFAPVDDPRIAVIVVADQPDLGGDSNRAGEVTTPVFKEIVAQSLRYMGVKPEYDSSDTAAEPILAAGDAVKTVPELIGLETARAVDELDARGFKTFLVGDGPKVLGQYPAAGEMLTGSPQVYLLTVPREEAPVPDLKGQSLRDAVQICALLDLRCEVDGEGYVVQQEVFVEEGKLTLHVVLMPPSSAGSAQADEEAAEAGEAGAEETNEDAEDAEGASEEET